MKQVRVTVVFEELDQNYNRVEKRYTMDTKWGAIAKAQEFLPPEAIAQKMSEAVYDRISSALPEFLKEQ